MLDVAIIGGGPAGAALARALTDRHLDVITISDERDWSATYGAWRDDIDGCEIASRLDSVLRAGWSTVRVVGTREHVLPRAYAVFDNALLRSSLMRDVPISVGVVQTVDHGSDHSTLQTSSGETIDARLVVDATGTGTFLVRRGTAAGAQTAYGLVLSSSRHATIGGVVSDPHFTLMDWSTPPTFLYSARFPDGSALVEETSLYAEPPHDSEDLRRRLAQRLGSDCTDQAVAVEHVNIPMGEPLPSRVTRTVGFGAAAGFIHPVTGYSVAASLRAAPRVAEAIRRGIAASRQPDELSRDAWAAVWPAHLVRTRAWHHMGLEALRSLPREAIPKFFDAFFELPIERWSAYLRVDSPPSEVRAAMLGVFRNVDAATRLRLMTSAGALWRVLAAR